MADLFSNSIETFDNLSATDVISASADTGAVNFSCVPQESGRAYSLELIGTIAADGGSITLQSCMYTAASTNLPITFFGSAAPMVNFDLTRNEMPAIWAQVLSGDDWIDLGENNDSVFAGDGFDYVFAHGGNDLIRGGAGNDVLAGGDGIDKAIYAGDLAGYLLKSEDSVLTITDSIPSRDGIDRLTSVERLQFSDTSLALDLDGNAGMVAKVLGAVFGAAALSNPQYVGVGLSLLDAGMRYDDLMQIALSAAGATTHAEEVNLLWTNSFGSAPTDAQAAPFVALLDKGLMSSVALGILVADYDINTTNINLVGLQSTGIAYSEYVDGGVLFG